MELLPSSFLTEEIKQNQNEVLEQEQEVVETKETKEERELITRNIIELRDMFESQ